MNAFTALADGNRRKIVELLATHGQLSATEICGHFSISAPAVSQHLKALKSAKLVKVLKVSQQRLYQLEPEGISEISGWLTEVKSLWSRRLDQLDQMLIAMHQQEET